MNLKVIVLGLVGALLAYLCWLLVRLLLSLRKKRPGLSEMPASSDESVSPGDMIQSRIIGGGLGNSSSSDVFHGHDGVESLPQMRLDASDRRVRPPAEPDAARFGFDALLEMRQTRHVVDDLQRQCKGMAEELAALRREVSELRAAAQVSPFYSEAVALARRGYDAQAIAERCGISVAEAEMVRSLSGESNQAEE